MNTKLLICSIMVLCILLIINCYESQDEKIKAQLEAYEVSFDGPLVDPLETEEEKKMRKEKTEIEMRENKQFNDKICIVKGTCNNDRAPDNEAENIKAFKQQASMYSWLQNNLKEYTDQKKWIHRLFDESSPVKLKHAKTLDLGAGTGFMCNHFAPFVKEMTAVDISEDMLAKAKESSEGKPINFLKMNAGNMTFKDETFDIVMSRLSLHHWSDPLANLKEVSRVLKEGGAFLLVDLVIPEEWAHKQEIINFIERRRDISHHLTYTESQLRHLLKKLGFIVKKLDIIEVPISFDTWVGTSATHPSHILHLREKFYRDMLEGKTTGLRPYWKEEQDDEGRPFEKLMFMHNYVTIVATKA